MAEYLGKVTGLVTGAELVGLTGVSRYTLITSGDIEWLKFKYKGNMLFIASKGISNSTPWYWLNQAGCVYGKDIVINNNTYNCRLMKGGKSDPASEIGGEWKDLIIDLVPDNAISNWSGNYTLCQEIYSANANYVICTGNNSVSMFYHFENTASRTDLLWRPVLELKCKLTNSISTQDLGNILNFENLTYTISGDTHTIVEELDGDIIKNLSNQVDGTTYTLDLSSKWDSLDYGKHTILITAIDSNGLDNTVSIIFNKIKPPITKPSENASLVDLVDFTEEINKEIEYQSFKLKNALIEKGVECSDSDKMSSLIDKVGDINTIATIAPSDNIIFNNSNQYKIQYGSWVEIFNYKCMFNGGVRVKFYIHSPMSGQTTRAYISKVRNGSLIYKTGEFSAVNGGYNASVDLTDIKFGDNLILYCHNNYSNTSYPSSVSNISIGGY